MYTEAAIQFYNLFYTSLPIILLGVYDIDIRYEIVNKFPQLYEFGVKYLCFNVCCCFEYLLYDYYHYIYYSKFLYALILEFDILVANIKCNS